jgi:two-component system chemotaxis response regulator CheB
MDVPAALPQGIRAARPSCPVVVVGASLGGLQALETCLEVLPAVFPAPLVVVQHLSDNHPTMFAELLAMRISLPTRWLNDRDVLQPGHVYIAPPRVHAAIDAQGRGVLYDGPRLNYARPSADTLFVSAATHIGARTIAVVLSGRLSDGAAGALAVRRAGGIVIVQDPDTCVATGMPRAAMAAAAPHFVLPPNVIGPALVALTMAPGGMQMFGWRSSAA